MSDQDWYRRYEQYKEEVDEQRDRFYAQCRQLGVEPSEVIEEIQVEIIARAVHESNWQEGIYLDLSRTTLLTDAVFKESINVKGPRLDMETILRDHATAVNNMLLTSASIEEIATYNLAVAHVAITLIGTELGSRQAASLASVLQMFMNVSGSLKDAIAKLPIAHVDLIRKFNEAFDKAGSTLEDTLHITDPVFFPLTQPIANVGELVSELIKLDHEDLLKPMRVDYIHFLHNITMMGIMPPKDRGALRTDPVTVGDPNISFPAPSLVPALMDNFCKTFPTILPTTTTYDPIRKAAETSYRFVRIHPYVDGNGRISRLLMNLVLWGHFPPVYLKADKKGRRKYMYALHRANRDDLEPLACLIAMSLRSIFDRLLDSITKSF